MLIAEDQLTGQLVHAANQPENVLGFCCPSCKLEVCFKDPRNARAHFAHFPTSRCNYGNRESWRHQEIQYEIVASLRRQIVKKKGMNFSLEVEKRIGDRKADIAFEVKSKGIKWVFEIQRSSISLEEIRSRTQCFGRFGYVTLWIIADQLIEDGKLPARWIQDLAHLHYGHAFIHEKKHYLRPVHIKRTATPPIVNVFEDLIPIWKLEPRRNKFFEEKPKIFCLPYAQRLPN